MKHAAISQRKRTTESFLLFALAILGGLGLFVCMGI